MPAVEQAFLSGTIGSNIVTLTTIKKSPRGLFFIVDKMTQNPKAKPFSGSSASRAEGGAFLPAAQKVPLLAKSVDPFNARRSKTVPPSTIKKSPWGGSFLLKIRGCRTPRRSLLGFKRICVRTIGSKFG